ncbi:hypothetical protein P7C70_g9028, partial [Phenoliferia sp. Uapishka_3]
MPLCLGGSTNDHYEKSNSKLSHSYSNADVQARRTGKPLTRKWIDEVLELCPGVKICLVALKCDLREDPVTRSKLQRYGQEPVQYEAVWSSSDCWCGLMTARRIRASRYLGSWRPSPSRLRFGRGLIDVVLAFAECSAKMDRGVAEAFQEAARVAVSARRKGENRGSDPKQGDGDWLDKNCVVS